MYRGGGKEGKELGWISGRRKERERREGREGLEWIPERRNGKGSQYPIIRERAKGGHSRMRHKRGRRRGTEEHERGSRPGHEKGGRKVLAGASVGGRGWAGRPRIGHRAQSSFGRRFGSTRTLRR